MTIEHWKTVAYVQIAFYVIVGIGHSVQLYKSFKARKSLTETSTFKAAKKVSKFYSLYLTIFIVSKIAGGICAAVLYSRESINTGLMIATYIFDSISLGLLMKSFLPILEFCLDKKNDINNGLTHEIKQQDNQETSIEKAKLHPYRIITLFIFIAVILSIVSSSVGSSPSNANTMKALLKVSAIFYLAAILLITGLIIYLIFIFTNLFYEYAHFIKCQLFILLGTTPFLLLRIIYSLLNAFSNNNIYTGNISKYTMLFGNYAYYTFLGFVEECVVTLIIIFGVFYFNRNIDSIK